MDQNRNVNIKVFLQPCWDGYKTNYRRAETFPEERYFDSLVGMDIKIITIGLNCFLEKVLFQIPFCASHMLRHAYLVEWSVLRERIGKCDCWFNWSHDLVARLSDMWQALQRNLSSIFPRKGTNVRPFVDCYYTIPSHQYW